MEPERALNRRQAIASGALALGAAYLAACGGDGDGGTGANAEPGDCVLTPEQSEGPYYLDNGLIRRDIAEDREGVPLELRLKVQQADSCEPIEGATVELWHCDAEGVYSGVDGDSGTFCRGGQPTNADGEATFATVFPGWYQGRAVHIHAKVHVEGDEVHTGQLYFDESDTSAVYAREPYGARGEADTPNSADGLYSQGGEQSPLKLSRKGEGYLGRTTLGVRASR